MPMDDISKAYITKNNENTKQITIENNPTRLVYKKYFIRFIDRSVYATQKPNGMKQKTVPTPTDIIFITSENTQWLS